MPTQLFFADVKISDEHIFCCSIVPLLRSLFKKYIYKNLFIVKYIISLMMQDTLQFTIRASSQCSKYLKVLLFRSKTFWSTDLDQYIFCHFSLLCGFVSNILVLSSIEKSTKIK